MHSYLVTLAVGSEHAEMKYHWAQQYAHGLIHTVNEIVNYARCINGVCVFKNCINDGKCLWERADFKALNMKVLAVLWLCFINNF